MFPTITAELYDRDGSLIQKIDLCRFWYAPPKIIIEGDNYFVRVSDDATTDPAVYRRTSAVKQIETLKK